jgi:hypothetical protein
MMVFCIKANGKSLIGMIGLILLLLSPTFAIAETDGYSITNGEADTGHPAVGLVNHGCTGTLIGTKTVLTASHCVDHSDTASFEVGGEIFHGAVNRNPRCPIINNKANPDYDMAIISLDRPVERIEPYPLCMASDQLRDLEVTLVGFGRTSADTHDFGTKRWGKNSIERSNDDLIFMTGGSQICFGDSGGPAFIDTGETPTCVIGVPTSTRNCMNSIHTRVDGRNNQDWLIGAVADDASVQWVTPCGRRVDINGRICRGSIDRVTNKPCVACEWVCRPKEKLDDDCSWGEPYDNKSP